MIDYGAGVSKGYVVEVSWGKSIYKYFYMQVGELFVDLNQFKANMFGLMFYI